MRAVVLIGGLVAGLGCGKQPRADGAVPGPDVGAAAVDPGGGAGPRPSEDDAEGLGEDAAVERAPIDVGYLAASEGVVFLRGERGCEPWQFVEGGARLERTDDESLDLVFSFAVAVRGPDALTLSEPRATSRGASIALDCPAGESRRDVFFEEEGDCEAGERGATVKASCSDVLLSDEQRGAALHRLEAERAAVAQVQAEAAAARLERFRAALRKHKAVFWRGKDGTCERWAVKKKKLVFKNGGGRVEYGMTSGLDSRTGAAQVDLTGPDSYGPDGSSGIGNWETLTIREVTDAHATVGKTRWYFTEAACRG